MARRTTKYGLLYVKSAFLGNCSYFSNSTSYIMQALCYKSRGIIRDEKSSYGDAEEIIGTFVRVELYFKPILTCNHAYLFGILKKILQKPFKQGSSEYEIIKYQALSYCTLT